MRVDEISSGVWCASTRYVNWYVVDGGAAGLTVIDGGLPAYSRYLPSVLAQLGRSRSEIRAMVLTHGHVDHIGLASVLAADGASVYLHPADQALAADPRSNKTEKPLYRYLGYPATLAFVGHCLANQALRPAPFPPALPLQEGEAIDIPGRPLVTHAPGHTDGSCVLEFRDHGVVFVGDLLCTVSPLTGRSTAPQIQTRGSNRNSEQALASLDRLASVQARVVLAGHGGPWRGGVEAAVALARRTGCR